MVKSDVQLMSTKICASITAKTFRELVEMAGKAEEEGASLLEIRLDYLKEDYSFKDIRELTSLPLIATCRLPGEGGLFRGEESKRISQLLSAVLVGFDYVDVELVTKDVKEVVKKAKSGGAKTIISKHDFSSTPGIPVLNRLFRKEIALGADVCKIVTTAKSADANLSCLRFIAKASKIKDVICFAMGPLGTPSRLLSPLFGGFLTYATVEEGKEAAPGQITISETRNFYEMMKYDS